MAQKVTYTLDEQTVSWIESAAAQLNKPKSAVVREAIADYHERIGRLSEPERQRLLKVIRGMSPSTGEAEAVDQELQQVRAARRKGGRRGSR